MNEYIQVYPHSILLCYVSCVLNYPKWFNFAFLQENESVDNEPKAERTIQHFRG